VRRVFVPLFHVFRFLVKGPLQSLHVIHFAPERVSALAVKRVIAHRSLSHDASVEFRVAEGLHRPHLATVWAVVLEAWTLVTTIFLFPLIVVSVFSFLITAFFGGIFVF